MATWNLRHGCGQRGGRVDLGAVAAGIAALDADVVAVQEVDRGHVRSGRVDQVAELARRLGWYGLFAPAIVGRPRGSRVATTGGGPAESGPAESGPLESGPVESGLVESGGVESGPLESGGCESGGCESGGCESGCGKSGRIGAGGAADGGVRDGRVGGGGVGEGILGSGSGGKADCCPDGLGPDSSERTGGERAGGERAGPRGGDDGGPAYGVGLLSRHPLVGRTWTVLPSGRATAGRRTVVDPEPRVVLRSAVSLPLGEVQVCATHLSWVPGQAWRQARAMLEPARAGPAVIAGDLNLPAAWLRAGLAGTAWTVARAGATYPASRPCLQLDHVLVRGARLAEVRVGPAGPSDHRAVVAAVVVGGEGRCPSCSGG